MKNPFIRLAFNVVVTTVLMMTAHLWLFVGYPFLVLVSLIVFTSMMSIINRPDKMKEKVDEITTPFIVSVIGIVSVFVFMISLVGLLVAGFAGMVAVIIYLFVVETSVMMFGDINKDALKE